MARQHDEAVARGEASIHDTLKEGDLMLFTDSDLGIEGSIIIDTPYYQRGRKYDTEVHYDTSGGKGCWIA